VAFVLYAVGIAVSIGALTGTALHGGAALAGFVTGLVIFVVGILVEERGSRA
jgi:hypothetical protein